MDITQIVNQKFNCKNDCNSRVLSLNPKDGSIYTGYIQKTTQKGSHVDFNIPEYCGLLIVSGKGTYKDAHHEIAINPGDFVQRIPGVTHSTLVQSDDWVELYLGIGSTLYKELTKLKVLSCSSPVIHPGVDFETVELFFSIYDRLGYMDTLELPLIVPKVVDYLTKINYKAINNNSIAADVDIIRTAASYIESNLQKRVTVEDVATHVNMGYEKFRKLFTAHYNISPGNYIIRRRIHLAQKLLSRDELSVKEISSILGYPDNFAFSKQFKKITGRTPSDFRNMFIQ